jgi:hypothetical protein
MYEGFYFVLLISHVLVNTMHYTCSTRDANVFIRMLLQQLVYCCCVYVDILLCVAYQSKRAPCITT